MAAVSTPLCAPSAQTVNTWTDLVGNLYANRAASLNFVKRYISLICSMVTFHRRIFPEEAYGVRRVEDKLVHILSSHTDMENVNHFLGLVCNSFKALESGYLEQLRIMITTIEDSEQKHLEEICLGFHYLPDGNLVVEHGTDYLEKNYGVPKETRTGTLNTFGNLLSIMNKLKPLPKTGYLTVTLVYNDAAPRHYNIPLYMTYDFREYPKIEGALKINIGDMVTPHVGTRMTLRTPMDAFQETEEDVHGDVALSQDICCPCGIKEESDMYILKCVVCSKRQHGICFGVVNAQAFTQHHVCDVCANETNKATDRQLGYELPSARKLLCLMRRAVLFCCEADNFSVLDLKKNLNITRLLAEKIVLMLEEEKLVTSGPTKFSRTVIKQKLPRCLKKYIPRYYNELYQNAKMEHERSIESQQCMEKATPVIAVLPSTAVEAIDEIDVLNEDTKKLTISVKQQTKSRKTKQKNVSRRAPARQYSRRTKVQLQGNENIDPESADKEKTCPNSSSSKKSLDIIGNSKRTALKENNVEKEPTPVVKTPKPTRRPQRPFLSAKLAAKLAVPVLELPPSLPRSQRSQPLNAAKKPTPKIMSPAGSTSSIKDRRRKADSPLTPTESKRRYAASCNLKKLNWQRTPSFELAPYDKE